MIIATRSSEVRVSLIDRIDVLNKSTDEISPAKPVLTTVSNILILTRDKTIDNKCSMLLSEYCVTVCETVRDMIRGKNAGDLDKSERTTVEDAGRVMRDIERTLRRGASTPQTRSSKGKIEKHVLEVQQLLDTLNALGSLPDENLCAVEHDSTLGSFHDATTTLSPGEACKRLIKREFFLHEFPLLAEAIPSSKDKVETIHRLTVNDAQAFADVIHEAAEDHNLPFLTRKKCLKLLYRTCGHHALVPETLRVEALYDRASDPLYQGGFANVWKGDSSGQAVAVKVIRTNSKSDLRKITESFCKEVVLWKFLQHQNIVPLIGVLMWDTRFEMVSEWMANGCINEYVKAHPGVNRFGLLAGAARGLIYLHGIGLVHGDLKGPNILIDGAHQARLVDFGLIKIISDPAINISSSNPKGGTSRWMGPELLYPERFGLEKCSPTKSSDCYALGMVIYEIICERPPFYEVAKQTVYVKLSNGEHPSRGAMFTDSLWAMLERCWKSDPRDRPNVEDVLRYLESPPSLPQLPLGPRREVEEDVDDSDPDQSMIYDRLLECSVNQSTRS